MKDTIKKLVEAWGPSGYEHHVRALIEAEVGPLVDEMRTDPMGNLICRMGSGGTRIMVAAHMDEIGMILTYQDEKGYFRFDMLGGLFLDTLNGNRVLFENGAIGVVSREGLPRRDDSAKLDEFYIDVSDGEGSAGVQVGDPAALTRNFEERGSRLVAKSMDDRIGCVVAIEAIKKLAAGGKLENEVYFVFTVQEEVGLRGARPAAFGLEPQLGLAVDVCPGGDVPGFKPRLGINLGDGAAIKVFDRGLVVPPGVKNLLIKRAEEADIPYQMELLQFGSTDAAGISLSGAGVPSGCISIPCRYVHTTSETVDVRDVQAGVDLLAATVSQPIELG